MSRELVISAAPHETRVSIIEDGQLCEIYIEREKEFALVGSIYKGRVTRVLPGMQSAFVDIGLDSDAFLYVGDFLENLEDYDHVAAAVEGKVEKMEEQGGNIFTPPPAGGVEELGPPASGAAASGSAAETPPELAEAESELQPDSLSQPPRAYDQAQPSGRSAFEHRGPSGGFNRGPRGERDRGGRRHGGRWQRGRGGRHHHGGRDLPPSKYASPRPYSPRPYEPPAEEGEGAANYEPVILPGESLAKYKDRMPSSPAAAPVEPPTIERGAGLELEPPASSVAELAGSLPASLYAQPEKPASGAEPEAAGKQVAPPTEQETEWRWQSPRRNTAVSFRSPVISEAEPPRPAKAPGATGPEEIAGSAHVTEEEMNVLSERLAEARHEEAAAEAEADEVHNEAEIAEDTEEGAEHDETASEGIELGENGGNGQIAEEEEIGSDLHAEEEREAAARAEAAGEGEAAAEAAEDEDEMPQPESSDSPALQASARVSGPPRARFQRPMRRGGRHRGHRPMHRREHHGGGQRPQPQRRIQLISEVLKPGQEIIVQIAKEPLGKKGARITSHVALPGRYLVYMPTVNHIGVSRRIGSAEERSRLRRIVSEAKGAFPGGFIVRTAAEGAAEEEIRSDVEFLGRTWEKIRQQAEPRKAPALLHRDLNLVERILRDYLSEDYSAIWIDNEEEFSKVVEFVSRFQPKLVSRVKLYTKSTPIFEEFGIQQELDKALRPKVWLKSGGYIVINHTEALVAIDVNTGKYVGRGSTRLEDTIVKTNIEAVKEIVRQIRLRDLGGIIVLDFIDMEERRNRDKVMQALEQALRADRAPSKVLSFNEFGLVAITRKRTKQALERVLCQPCPYCTGSGMVKSVPTICYEIQAEARKMAADMDAGSITLRVHPEIAKALKTRESVLVEELEQTARKSVIIQADPTLHWEQYDIY